MAEPITIRDEDLVSLAGKTVVITGGCSGIGLATVRQLLKLGAEVAIGDINPPSEEIAQDVVYKKVDVTSWEDQRDLFETALATFGKIDHAFANAGSYSLLANLAINADILRDTTSNNLHGRRVR